MTKDAVTDQPVTWATIVIAALLMFLALRFAAGFDLGLSIIAGLALGTIAYVVRRKMLARPRPNRGSIIFTDCWRK
ncbi:MAG: hypothetical protein ACU0CA_01385 [Paracoccaceae bacterium]